MHDHVPSLFLGQIGEALDKITRIHGVGPRWSEGVMAFFSVGCILTWYTGKQTVRLPWSVVDLQSNTLPFAVSFHATCPHTGSLDGLRYIDHCPSIHPALRYLMLAVCHTTHTRSVYRIFHSIYLALDSHAKKLDDFSATVFFLPRRFPSHDCAVG